MGNRAVIVVDGIDEVGVYVHWQGEPEDVLAFVHAAQRRGARDPGYDPAYCLARIAQAVLDSNTDNYETGVGIGPIDRLDTSQHGVYKVCEGWVVLNADGVEVTPDNLVREAQRGFDPDEYEELPDIDAARTRYADKRDELVRQGYDNVRAHAAMLKERFGI